MAAPHVYPFGKAIGSVGGIHADGVGVPVGEVLGLPGAQAARAAVRVIPPVASRNVRRERSPSRRRGVGIVAFVCGNSW
ncbi:hypothetical protein GCM10025774_18020 [Microbacterium kyungheense]